jgi:hypothetical protein
MRQRLESKIKWRKQMQTFKLDLTTTEVNFVLETLGSLPSKSGVWPLILKIKEQAEAQVPKDAPTE